MARGAPPAPPPGAVIDYRITVVSESPTARTERVLVPGGETRTAVRRTAAPEPTPTTLKISSSWRNAP